LSYTSRGWHTSGGAIDTAGPKDIDDFSRVIDWLIANAPVDPERIGAAGISYGSGISLIGAAHDERIKAVAALSTWGSLVEALYAQQTPRLVWGTLLTETAPIFGNPDPHIDSLWNSVLTHSNIEMVTAWAMQRSPIRYVDRLNANGTAVYFAKNWGDDMFQPNSILDMYSRLTGPKHIDLQAGTHASTEIFGMIGSGDTRIWNNTHRWFDKHLKGLPTAIDDQLPVQMKVKMTDRYEGFADWPVPNARQARWYLHPRSTFSPGELEDTPWQGRSPVENTLSSWADTLASTGIPLAAQMFEQIKVPVTAPILLLGRDRSTWFQTDRLSQPMKIRGIPTLKLQVTPQHDKAQLVAYLYDMNALGVGTLISHAPITVPQATPGKPLTLDIHLVATAYDVPKGNRLVLVVDTQDPLYKKVSNGTLRVDVDFSKERASVLEVPVL
ncbi:MAG: CocE/NonD family hydrolase, partial [Gammaproteobacteria bacterium]|nr:CocE/NonD family hydrolase [Gammaproteobacteria bacterium]